jgi:AraC-like DNA-binding protein
VAPMPWPSRDCRSWIVTDRPGERITSARPASGIEVVSVSGSNRCWRDAHDGFTLAIIHRDQPGLQAQWTTRGRSMTAGGGQIMAIEPGDVHVTERLQAPPRGADFDIIRLAPELVAEVARKLGVRGAFHFDSPTVDEPHAFAALRSLVDALADGQDAAEIEAAGTTALHALVSRLGEGPAFPARHAVRDYRLRRLRDYLHAHVEKRPSLAELEAVTGLSKWRICVLFEQAYGTSIGTYWRAVRAREAARRLQRGTPIKMIVGELGYADSPHFCREFKAQYGVTPGRWLALLSSSYGGERGRPAPASP